MASETKVKITYEALYDVLLREKQREALQPLDDSFWTDSLAYLREKQEILDSTRNKVDLFSAAEREKTAHQMRNVRRILKEIYDRREKKIIDIARNKSMTGSKIIDLSNQLGVEKQLFEAVVNELNFFRQGLLHNILDMRAPSMWIGDEAGTQEPTPPSAHPPEGMTLTRMTIDVPQFVGSELEVYGPYKAGEMVPMPKEIAAALINNGSAVEETQSATAESTEDPWPETSLGDEQQELTDLPDPHLNHLADEKGIDSEHKGPGEGDPGVGVPQ